MITGLVIGLAAGAALGVVVGLLVRSGHVAAARTAEARLADALQANQQLVAEAAGLQGQVEAGHQQVAGLRAELAGLTADLDHQRRAAEERAAAFEETRLQLTGEFARLSTEALQRNNEQFLQLADTKLKETRQAAEGELAKRQEAIEQLLKPIGVQLGKYEEGMQRLEVERKGAYATLTQQMKQLSTSHDQLQKETGNLVKALRAPQTRGRWGELQLRRVVEMAGMLEHCDFEEQVTSDADSGRLRPDMVVHLPGVEERGRRRQGPHAGLPRRQRRRGRDVRRLHLASHARQLRAHVDRWPRRSTGSGSTPRRSSWCASCPATRC